MPSIDIRRRHDKSMKEAKLAVEHVAQKLSDKFDVEYCWDGHTLAFERSGVHGQILLSKGEVHVQVNLGFLLLALRGPIEAEIHKYLDREFA